MYEVTSPGVEEPGSRNREHRQGSEIDIFQISSYILTLWGRFGFDGVGKIVAARRGPSASLNNWEKT